jgi:hypothetical protein
MELRVTTNTPTRTALLLAPLLPGMPALAPVFAGWPFAGRPAAGLAP